LQHITDAPDRQGIHQKPIRKIQRTALTSNPKYIHRPASNRSLYEICAGTTHSTAHIVAGTGSTKFPKPQELPG
jgi:hypothetical protein